MAKLTAETITDDMIRELRAEQLNRWREWSERTDDRPEPFPAADLDCSFAALSPKSSIAGLFSMREVTRAEGRARCAEILEARRKEGK